MDLPSPAPGSLDPDPPGGILLPMQITVEPHDQAAVLHLRGEFDTFSCPSFQDEVAESLKSRADAGVDDGVFVPMFGRPSLISACRHAVAKVANAN